MKMDSRLIDLIRKKNKLHVQHGLSFPFPVVLHDYNAVLYD